MEKKKKPVLEKIGIRSLAIIVTIVMAFAGLAGLVSIKPASAAIEQYCPGSLYYGWVPLDYWLDEVSDYDNQWTCFTPEGWLIDAPNQFGTVMHAHELAHCAYWNHTTPVANEVAVIQDTQSGTYWYHDSPTVNDFIIYPMQMYMIRWVIPLWLWYALNDHSGSGNYTPPTYQYWLTELALTWDRNYTFSRCVVDDAAWDELDPSGWGQNYIGMNAHDYLYHVHPAMAHDLIDRMYYENGTRYAGEWNVGYWAGWGWQYYNPCHPEWDFPLYENHGYKLWVNQHCHLCWGW